MPMTLSRRSLLKGAMAVVLTAPLLRNRFFEDVPTRTELAPPTPYVATTYVYYGMGYRLGSSAGRLDDKLLIKWEED